MLQAPIDYSLGGPTSSEKLMNTVQIGRQFNGFNAEQAAMKSAQAAAEQQAALNADLAGLSVNPTPSAISKVMVKYPTLSEHFKRTYDTLDNEQRIQRVGEAQEIYSALNSGNPEIAVDVIAQKVEAYRNSGLEDEAKALETLAQRITENPEAAKTTTGMFLASAMGPDKFTETFTNLQKESRESELQPSELTKAQADARKSAVAANFAESEAVMNLERAGWDILKIQEDSQIARQNGRIAALDAQIKKETNELKREEMMQKMEGIKFEREELIREKSASAESARFNIDNMMNTLDRIALTPAGVISDATGPVESRLPTISQDVADFEELITNLDAQAFLSQIPNITGMGALSDSEGKKLAAALQNFSLRQSPDRLMANVKEAQRLMLKARENLAKKFGVPETVPDTPSVQPSSEEIDSIVNELLNGGPR